MAETNKKNRNRTDKLLNDAMKKKRSDIKETLEELKEQVQVFKKTKKLAS